MFHYVRKDWTWVGKMQFGAATVLLAYFSNWVAADQWWLRSVSIGAVYLFGYYILGLFWERSHDQADATSRVIDSRARALAQFVCEVNLGHVSKETLVAMSALLKHDWEKPPEFFSMHYFWCDGEAIQREYLEWTKQTYENNIERLKKELKEHPEEPNRFGKYVIPGEKARALEAAEKLLQELNQKLSRLGNDWEEDEENGKSV